MATIEERKAALLARLEELNARLDAIEDEIETHEAQDWEEEIIELETDEVLTGVALSEQTEIRAIKAALQRIEEGEYGYCTSCGVKIPEERLDLLPYTPFCELCAKDISEKKKQAKAV